MINTQYSRKQNISFGTKINFIPYDRFRHTDLSDFTYFDYDFDSVNIINGKKLYTEGVASCASGILLDGQKTSAFAWHILNSKKVYSKLTTFSEKIKPQLIEPPSNAILIGSKNQDYSKPTFENIRKQIKEMTTNISLFECQKNIIQATNFSYDSNNDLLDIYVAFYNDKIKSIKSYKDLFHLFENIQISPTDELYIDGRLVKKGKK